MAVAGQSEPVKTMATLALASLLLAAVPASAHNGEAPTAANGDLMILLGAASVEVWRDSNGNGVIDRAAHDDDPETEEDESHTADELVLALPPALAVKNPVRRLLR